MWVICTALQLVMVLEELCTLFSLNVTITTLLRNPFTEEQDEGMLEEIHFPLNDRNDIPSLESKLRDPNEEKKVVSKLWYLNFNCPCMGRKDFG
ncbi:hypothetical protein E2C01_059349 [Portunus trituberculatus]|uniref:Uncharacterized protein n=1 Tax=Portunus trituberculatus TaxID=210409 RepID=A0A5B7H7B7_PORTR|nr:hypothetical protein [Portunus trituberculatus]